MDVLLDYVSFGHFSPPYARTGHICVIGCQLALRYSKDPDFEVVSLITMLVLLLSLFFDASLFHCIQIVYIALCGLNILLDM
jgi:hypothetical protein